MTKGGNHSKDVLKCLDALDTSFKSLHKQTNQPRAYTDEMGLLEMIIAQVEQTRVALLAQGLKRKQDEEYIRTSSFVAPHAPTSRLSSPVNGATKANKAVKKEKGTSVTSPMAAKVTTTAYYSSSSSSSSSLLSSSAAAVAAAGAVKAAPSPLTNLKGMYSGQLGGSMDWSLCMLMAKKKAKKGHKWVKDVDVASVVKVYELPDEKLRALNNRKKKRAAGEHVMAIYPATTTFYPGTITWGSHDAESNGVKYVAVSIRFDGDAADTVFEVDIRYVYDA